MWRMQRMQRAWGARAAKRLAARLHTQQRGAARERVAALQLALHVRDMGLNVVLGAG